MIFGSDQGGLKFYPQAYTGVLRAPILYLMPRWAKKRVFALALDSW
jgi:hypothetical protein